MSSRPLATSASPPPAGSAAERAILGAVLLDGRMMPEVEALRPEDFSLDSDRRIFARMLDLSETGRPIDLVTLAEELGRHKDLKAIGGAAYLSSLTDGMPRRASVEHYVKIVRKAAFKRKVASKAERLNRRACEPLESAQSVAEEHDCLLEAIAGGEVAIPPDYSEEKLAQRFSRRHADHLRFTAQLGRWHRWDGRRWAQDTTLSVFDKAREVCRQEASECREPTTSRRIASAATVAAIERLARADRRHAAQVEQWDADPWLLNTPTGRIDLRTGEVSDHRPADYCTKITAAGPHAALPERWFKFLSRVTGGSDELVQFLQRVSGYILTGCTREQSLFFLYGTGANGKSVFLNTLRDLLNDYATTAPISTFVASNVEGHPTDLAGLRGARLVAAVETEDGRRWAEAKIKALTGGDRIAARFMRGDFFEFVPQFKLVIAGNHKPGLRAVDEAIRRRFQLIPFTVTIPESERDPNLGEALRSEWPGILQWMIEGCVTWQRQGLKPPAEVRQATEAYLAGEDAVGRWMEDCCEEARQDSTLLAELYGSWSAWCEAAGEYSRSQRWLASQLEDRGIVKGRQAGTGLTSFLGLAVKIVKNEPLSTVHARDVLNREQVHNLHADEWRARQ